MRNLTIGSVLAIAAVALASCGGISIEDKRPVFVTACQAFDPIYLDDDEIRALKRATKELIATHNASWEKLCKR